uniref:CERK_C domain-containing protein n=1 Tax=Schistocephalus solidus TaxID=70667 RepID=A0A183SIE1_SCHSO
LSFLRLTSYHGRICFLPSKSSSHPLDSTVCHVECKVCAEDVLNASEDSPAENPTTGSAGLLLSPPSVHEPASDASAPSDTEEVDVSAGDGEQGTREDAEESSRSNSDFELSPPNRTPQIFPQRELPDECTLKPGWKSVTGSFIAINAFPISCRCGKSPQGPAPSAHLGDGCLDLVLVHKCSHYEFLQYLILMANARAPGTSPHHAVSADHLKLPFVEVHRVRAMEFIPLDRNDRPLEVTAPSTVSDSVLTTSKHSKHSHPNISVWCVDGEILRQAHVSGR